MNHHLEEIFIGENLLEILASGNPHMVWVRRSENTFEYINQKVSTVTGLSLADFNAGEWKAAIHPDDYESVRSAFSACNHRVEPYEIEFRLKNNSGEYRWTYLQETPVLANKCSVVWVAGAIDVHARKMIKQSLRDQNSDLSKTVVERNAEIETQRHLMDVVLDALPIPAIIANAQGKLIRVNAACHEVLGIASGAAELQGYQLGTCYWPNSDRTLSVEEWPLYRALVYGEICAGTLITVAHAQSGNLVSLVISAAPVFGSKGELIAGVMTAIDVTAREKAVQALRESDERFQAFMRYAPIWAWIVDSQQRFEYANPGLVQLLDQTLESILKLDSYSVFPPEIAAKHVKNNAQVLAENRALTTKENFKYPNGEVGLAYVVKFPMHSSADHPLIGGVAIDITSSSQAEKAIGESEERFRNAFDHAPIGMAIVSLDGRWVRVNRSLCDMTGYSPAELLQLDLQSITQPDDLNIDLAQLRALIEGAIFTYQVEKRYYHKRGHILHVLHSVSVVKDADGQPLHFVSQIEDITQRKLANEALESSLQEKVVLLKEIHHRVKNNLQIISALLELQSGHARDPDVLAMFKESQARVKSMALIHEQLYRTGNFAHVHFNVYVRELAISLYYAYGVSGDDIKFDFASDAPAFPIDIAVPCGLLVNELISNSLKHAFKDQLLGTIRVLFQREGDTVRLIVSDTGRGFPSEIDFRNTDSFGLQLVNTLVEQLGGEISLATRPGTTFTIRFPMQEI